MTTTMLTESETFRCSPADKEDIAALAALTGASRGKVIRTALRAYRDAIADTAPTDAPAPTDQEGIRA